MTTPPGGGEWKVHFPPPGDSRFMPDRCGLTLRAALAVLIALLSGGGGRSALATDTAGVQIINRASATYLHSADSNSDTVSNTTSAVIAPVSAVALTPDDVAVSGFIQPEPVIVRRFTLTNRANRNDRYLITAASASAPATLQDLYFDLDGNGVIDPTDLLIVIGATHSPMLASDASVTILLRYTATGLSDGTVVTTRLSAMSTEPGSINGIVSDEGTRLDQVGANALFTHPTDPGQPPLKTVDGLPRSNAVTGQEVTFRIAFVNSGTDPGLNTLVTDTLPAGLTYVAGSAVLDGTPQTDAPGDDAVEAGAPGITVRFASVPPAETHEIQFRARVDVGLPRGTLLENRASFVADGTTVRDSSPAELLLNPFGRLLDTSSGVPVRGAQVSLLTGPLPGTLLALPPLSGSGAIPNVDNTNPFNSDVDGRYSFLLDA